MKYNEINAAILDGHDVSVDVVKNNAFYKYLLNNKVAYYYCKLLSKTPTAFEESIILKGDEINEKYAKTLHQMNDICKKNNIDFLLYKTHKHIPEVVDGDIDVFVHEKDFQNFLTAFAEEGFSSIEDEPGKGKCEKVGFCVIEPHVSISWRDGKYVSESYIWKNTMNIQQEIKTASFEIELISLIGKVFFEPQYLDLYSLKSIQHFLKSADVKTLLENIQFKEAFEWLLKKADNIDRSERLPYFADLGQYLSFWTRECKQRGNWNNYWLHIAYRIYWKVRYAFVGKLPFTHKW